MRRLLIVLALIAVPSAAAIPPATEQAIAEISADELRTYVVALAADEMNGRGVAPAAADYLQPVEVYRPALAGKGRLRVSDGDRAPLADLEIGDDFYPL